jgi:hypothetical protein
MIGPKAIACMALLCALLLSAFAASSASAATSGTTAFTCAPNSLSEGTFKDAHCDEPAPGIGKFTHKALSTNPTGFTLTNAETKNKTTEATPAVLKGTLGGVASEIVCKNVHGHGTLENSLSGEKHSVSGTGTVDYTECSMPKPVNAEGKERCKVGEPIKFEANSATTENGEEMGGLFTPKEAGKPFVGLTFSEGPGTKCPVAGKTVNVTGSAEATAGENGESKREGGATLTWTEVMTKGAKCETAEQSGLCLGGQAAEFSSTVTFRMLMTTEGAPENAVSFTTPRGLTAFTCIESPTHEGDFKDAHCDEAVTAGTGQFTHKALPTNPTTVTSTNAETKNKTTEATPSVFKAILGGVTSEIVCKTRQGHGTLENTLTQDQHSVVGSGTTSYAECTMPKPVNGEGKERCKVSEPIQFEFKAISTENGKEMGALFRPKEGTTFVRLSFSEGPGMKCPIAGKEMPVTGNAEATGGEKGESEKLGATLTWTNAMTKGSKCEAAEQKGLCLGAQSAEYSATATGKMITTTEGTPENAITATTPPFTADA